MAHDQEAIQLETLQANRRQTDERWPVPYAIMLITGVSVALWSLIIGVTSWLIG
jgi:hypothetical protein